MRVINCSDAAVSLVFLMDITSVNAQAHFLDENALSMFSKQCIPPSLSITKTVVIQLPSLPLMASRTSLWSVIDKDVCVLSGSWVSTEAVEV
ncbi:hypothetical protein LEMLEM_LOCUS16938 [Lemmus lemmus]